MKPWVIDANIWIAAADPTHPCSPVSRSFLHAIMRSRDRVALPAIGPLQVTSALARRFCSAATDRALDHRLVHRAHITLLEFEALNDSALELGSRSFLRAADALYAAAAHETGAQVTSWDQELVQRARAVTPAARLASHVPA